MWSSISPNPVLPPCHSGDHLTLFVSRLRGLIHWDEFPDPIGQRGIALLDFDLCRHCISHDLGYLITVDLQLTGVRSLLSLSSQANLVVLQKMLRRRELQSRHQFKCAEIYLAYSSSNLTDSIVQVAGDGPTRTTAPSTMSVNMVQY